MPSLLRFLDRYLEESVGAVMLALMASISFINVIVRYCTNLSFASSEELTVNLFVWIVLLGTARAFREGSNFAMSLIFNRFRGAARTALLLFSAAVSILFFAALFWQGMIEVMDEIELEVVSEALAIPVWLYTSATPIGSVLVIIRIVERLIEEIRSDARAEDLKEAAA